jgi:hypothetical protein
MEVIMNYIVRTFVLAIAIMSCSAIASAENVIFQWDRVLGQTLGAGIHPGHIHPTRSFSMLHLAMFDAANSVDGSYEPYLTEVPGTKNASIEAAAAYAAHGVLSGLYPSRIAVYDAELAASLEGIKPNRAHQAERVGTAVAKNMLANRANDGWDAPWTPYILDMTPGNWQETAPGPYPGFAVFTNIVGARPFGLTSATQFLPGQPPALSSSQYSNDLNEVKDVGLAGSVTRTADQTLTAFLWAIPPVSDAKMFGVVASTSVQQDLSTVERARLFALANMAVLDALQTTLTSQYTYGRWRPVTAIRRADEDGNPATTQDPAWESLLGPAGTPPHPSYASNGSSVSASIRFFAIPERWRLHEGNTSGRIAWFEKFPHGYTFFQISSFSH